MLGKTIIFLDEIDSIGCNRDNKNAHIEGNQNIINELLVQLDGFQKKPNIFIIAATNYADELDPALLRSGRIDKTIKISKPTL